MDTAKSTSLPVIPLPKGTVLLPGIAMMISVSASRPDIHSLLADIYSKGGWKGQKMKYINVACVPLNSPYLTRHGQKMISRDGQALPSKDVQPETARKEDLFGYGVAAKIKSVQGQNAEDISLLVEGIARIRVDNVTQERPYFEADVTYEHDDGTWSLPFSSSIADLSQLYLPRTWKYKDCSHT